MTDQEIEKYRQELTEILERGGKRTELRGLAIKVGASAFEPLPTSNMDPDDLSWLVHNIHFALQTASMANMCEVASKGHQTALEACESAKKSGKAMAIVTVISLIIAGLSVLAAWAAVIVGIITN